MEMSFTSEGLIRKTFSHFSSRNRREVTKGASNPWREITTVVMLSIQHKDLKIYQHILSKFQTWENVYVYYTLYSTFASEVCCSTIYIVQGLRSKVFLDLAYYSNSLRNSALLSFSHTAVSLQTENLFLKRTTLQ
jgi:hypothetical protein